MMEGGEEDWIEGWMDAEWGVMRDAMWWNEGRESLGKRLRGRGRKKAFIRRHFLGNELAS